MVKNFLHKSKMDFLLKTRSNLKNTLEIEEIVLSEKLQKISATKIRKELRKKGKLK